MVGKYMTLIENTIEPIIELEVNGIQVVSEIWYSEGENLTFYDLFVLQNGNLLKLERRAYRGKIQSIRFRD